jgi:hypothetical protein
VLFRSTWDQVFQAGLDHAQIQVIPPYWLRTLGVVVPVGMPSSASQKIAPTLADRAPCLPKLRSKVTKIQKDRKIFT